MATFTTNPNQAARLDLFQIGMLDGDYQYEATATDWRVGPLSADLGTNIEFQGTGFTYSSGGALIGGTIHSITSHLSGPIRFQFSGFSMSAAVFNAHKGADDSQGFLADVFSGNDTMTGSNLADVLFGYAGSDHLEGLDGNDVLDGGAGSDTLVGGLGNDLYVIDSVGDAIVESGKNTGDTVDASISIDLTKAAYDGIEHVTLSGSTNLSATGDSFVNHLTGNAGANKLSGGAANDTLSGLAGDDILDGGSGRDTLKGGSGNDTYYVDTDNELIFENEIGKDTGGTDTVFSSAETFMLPGYFEHLTLIGTAKIGIGNDSANTLTGNASHNLLYGMGGADTLIGGAGNDEYYVDTAKDTVIETSTGGTYDSVHSTASSYTLPNYIEFLRLLGSSGIDGTGNSLDNDIYGNDGANKIDGAAGDDDIFGGAGNDTLIGGAGNDDLVGGAGLDTLDTSLGNDTVFYSSGCDVILGFDGDPTGGQDTLNLYFHFFRESGIPPEDRAERIHVSKQGTVTDVWLDYDGDGAFDFTVAEIHTVDIITVGSDITVN